MTEVGEAADVESAAEDVVRIGVEVKGEAGETKGEAEEIKPEAEAKVEAEEAEVEVDSRLKIPWLFRKCALQTWELLLTILDTPLKEFRRWTLR